MGTFLLVAAVLVQLLGDDRFPVREAATAGLLQFGELAEPLVADARLSADPEVAYRADKITMAAWRARATRIGKNRGQPWPWIDMLPDEVGTRSEIIRYWVDQAPAGATALDWPTYREATRLYVESLISGGASEDHIGDLLAQMQERERAWRKRLAACP